LQLIDDAGGAEKSRWKLRNVWENRREATRAQSAGLYAAAIIDFGAVDGALKNSRGLPEL
jgi:hypothetical protein